MNEISIDSLLPKEMAKKAENAGVIKANLDIFSTLLLAVLAGVFIALGAAFYTTVIAGNGAGETLHLPYGIMKLIGGLVFSLGLILVVIAGAELFTGNVLLVMAAASKKLSIYKLARNWLFVYIGNFAGSVLMAYLILLSGKFDFMRDSVCISAVSIAAAKCGLTFVEALVRGIFCNMLVCLAVWLTLSGRTTFDKIGAIIFPITAFVAMGFEHSVANMYFIPIGILIKANPDPDFWNAIGKTVADVDRLTWQNFFSANLFPVTIGNIIGGAIVGMMYWGVYCRPNLMNAENKTPYLRKMIKTGRRRNERFNVHGSMSLNFNSSTIHGVIQNFNQDGILGKFKDLDDVPRELENVSVDLETSDDHLKIYRIGGTVTRIQSPEGPGDSKSTEIAVEFTRISAEAKSNIQHYLQQLKPIESEIESRSPLVAPKE